MTDLAAALVLGALHLLAARLRFLDGIPRSRWLSVAGGISVAYVIVHLLPELAEYQEAIGEHTPTVLAALERHVYILALVGLAVFYGMEHWARASRSDGGAAATTATAFNFGSYAAYNAVIGYLMVRREEDVAFFAIAMGLHFVVNDHGLRQHHRTAYHRYGRWLLSVAVVAGALVGVAAEMPEAVLGLLVAFIGGGTILNVLKEELPEDRESRFSAFLLGAAAYTLLLLAF